MANTLLLKRNASTGVAPAAGSLSVGELAINTTDGILYTKLGSGTVVQLANSATAPSQLKSGGFVSLNTTNDASAVNYLEARATATLTALTLTAQGTDTNISINLVSKGTGTVQANGAVLASQSFVSASYAPLASPTLTGTPAAPTAAQNTSTTQLATTAFVIGQASSTTPNMNGAAAVGTGTTFARADHTHPTDTSRAPLASPTFTGTPTAPTATLGTNTTQLATTAFVKANAPSIGQAMAIGGKFFQG